MSTGEVELKEKVVDKKMIKGHRELRVAAPYKESRGKSRAGRGNGRGENKGCPYLSTTTIVPKRAFLSSPRQQ